MRTTLPDQTPIRSFSRDRSAMYGPSSLVSSVSNYGAQRGGREPPGEAFREHAWMWCSFYESKRERARNAARLRARVPRRLRAAFQGAYQVLEAKHQAKAHTKKRGSMVAWNVTSLKPFRSSYLKSS